MAIPDPPPNSLGLDLVRPEPASDPQSTSPSLASTSIPEPATQPTTNITAENEATTPTAATTPTTDVTKVEDVAKLTAAKKNPYVNPERVKTGGLPRDKLTDEELAERMARMREQNEKIKQRRLDVAADEDAFKQTQAAERQRQAQMRKVQETVNRTREQNAQRKMDKIQSREWDSEKKAERWQAAKSEPPAETTATTTSQTDTGGGETESAPTEKQREDTGSRRGGKRGRGRGRGRGSVRVPVGGA
ncbi:hypothetical protein EI94DRAFT_1712541 [Lactarius quietus]|nr:hypothetical protein EI94DRAFT_1712541 [Lactarius quietus]